MTTTVFVLVVISFDICTRIIKGTEIGIKDSDDAILLLDERMSCYLEMEHFENIHNTDAMQLLSSDIRVSITIYLERRDIHSFMRTSKNNLDSCKQYVHDFVTGKFRYLLNHNESKITIKHLLKIPFVDPISINSWTISFYFRPFNRTSSKYIGIDNVSGNAFISFWIKKVHLSHHQWKIITFIFNGTGIDCIYCSDTSQIFTLKKSIKINSIKYKQSDLNDIKAINALLLNKKISSILGEDDTWCLNEHWFDAMIWPRIKGKFTKARRCVQCKTRKSRQMWVVFLTGLAASGAIVSWTSLMLWAFDT